MSDDNSKIKIRLGSFELEVEGKEDYVNTIIGEDITEFIEKIKPFITEYLMVKNTFDSTKEDQTQSKSGSIIDTNIPQITGTQGLRDGIKKLFATEWGKAPRSISEINIALETNALHYDVKNIGSRLAEMIKQGEIRRIGTKRNYQYINK